MAITGTVYSNHNLRTRIINRHSDFVARRSPYDDQTDEICDLFRPDLVKGLVGDKEEGAFASSRIIEGTAPYAAQVWQRGFYGNIMSMKTPWWRDKLTEPPTWSGIKFKGNDDVNQYLQDVDDHLRSVYRKSNFYNVMPQFILDGGTTGSPVMLRERDLVNDRVICKVPDYTARWLDKDIFGFDNVLHVEWEWTVLQANSYFKKEDLPLVIQNAMDNGRHNDKFKFLQVIYPAGDMIFDDLPEEDKKYKTSHPWMEYFVCISGTDDKQQKILTPKMRGPGYYTRPFSSWHYWRNWHESYGKSMAWWAIYDVKGSNAHWEALFGEAEISIKPPTWAMRTLRGMLDLGPGGDNWARDDTEYDRPPQFLDRKTNWNPAIDFADRLNAAIKRHFHNDLFLGTTQLEQSRNQPETAYGLWLMKSEQNVQLLPQVETFENQVLKDNHEAFMEMERMAEPAYPWGRLPEPPDIVKEWAAMSDGGVESEVEFLGELSMAQERDVNLGRYLKAVGISKELYEFDPNLVFKVKWSQAYEKMLESMNFPASDLVPEDEYQAFQQAMRQRAEQERLAEQGLVESQSVKNLQGETSEGSPLKQLEGAVT